MNPNNDQIVNSAQQSYVPPQPSKTDKVIQETVKVAAVVGVVASIINTIKSLFSKR